MSNYLSVIISSLAFVLSLYQFVRNNDRNKKEATLIAYKELQKEFAIIKSVKDKLETIERNSEEWVKITACLANIENFCVGINTNIYDIRVLNRLSGSFFIEQYELLEPIIQRKRERENSNELYEGFRETVEKLRKIRKQYNTGVKRNV